MKPFLQEVAERLVLDFGEDLQDCAIVFNNKRPVTYLNNHLAHIWQKPFWSSPTFTVQEFLNQSTDMKVADFYAQFFTLYQVFNELLQGEDGDEITMDKFFPISRTILSDFAQMDMDRVSAVELFRELEDIAVIDRQFDFLTIEQHEFLSRFWSSYSEGKHKKQQENFIRMWRRMPRLYEEFHRRLQQKGLITQAQVYRQLADGQCARAEFVQQYKKLIFIGFNALSQSEAILFKRWQEEGRAVFFFDTDHYYLDDVLHEAGLFLRKNIEKYGLVNQLDNDRRFLAHNTSQAHVYKVQGHSAQAKFLNTVLHDDYRLLYDNPSYGGTAVILADESLLIPTLQTIPYEQLQKDEQNNVPINLNMTMGIGYISSPLYGYADLWLNIQTYLRQTRDQDAVIPYRFVELFLTHPLSHIAPHTRQQIGSALIQAQVAQIPLAQLTAQNGMFKIFFEPVEVGASLSKKLREVLDYTMQALLHSNQLTEINAALFGKTLQELNRLHDTLQQYTHGVEDMRFVVGLIQQALQSITVPLSGDPLSGLQIMGLLESRSLHFDHVVFVGMNDGTLPKNTATSSFIPDSLRRVYGLPVLENQDAISAYIFYRLIQRAKKVSFVYNSLTDENNTGEPSRFLKQLEYESSFQFIYYEQDTVLEVEKSAKREIRKTEGVRAILAQYLEGGRTLSASALTTYIANPIDFFFKEIAGIKEPEEIKEVVEANHLGSILHQTLEDLYADMKKENTVITKVRIQQARKNIGKLIEESFLKIIYPIRPEKIRFTGMQRVIMAIVEEYCNIILDHDEESTPFELIQMEETMVVPFAFMDVDGHTRQIQLKGIIDRVQIGGNGKIQIIDYKTGSDDIHYKSLEEAFDTHGKKQNKALLQTLFYTYVFESAKQISSVEPNLYVVRKMKKDGTLFQTKIEIEENGKIKNLPVELTADFLTRQKADFVELLRQKLQELFDPDTPFYVSDHQPNFRYSPYKNLIN